MTTARLSKPRPPRLRLYVCRSQRPKAIFVIPQVAALQTWRTPFFSIKNIAKWVKGKDDSTVSAVVSRVSAFASAFRNDAAITVIGERLTPDQSSIGQATCGF